MNEPKVGQRQMLACIVEMFVAQLNGLCLHLQISLSKQNMTRSPPSRSHKSTHSWILASETLTWKNCHIASQVEPCRDQGPRAKEQEPTTKGQGQKHIVHFNESFVPIQSFRHQIAATAACGKCKRAHLPTSACVVVDPWCAKPSHGRTACSKLSDPNLTPCKPARLPCPPARV